MSFQNHLSRLIDLSFRGPSADGQSQGSRGFVFAAAEAGEDMADRNASRAAGAAGREAQALEGREQGLDRAFWKHQGQVDRGAFFGMAVQAKTGKSRAQSGPQAFPSIRAFSMSIASSCEQISAAAPSPTMPGTFGVPERSPRS